MSKQETVEITVKLPKKVVDVVEGENYFGYTTKEEFYENAVRSLMGGIVGHWDIDDWKEFHSKHGKEISVFYLPKGFS